ncbi:MAG: response regulator [Anaerolineales bacterium]|nr:response regulator [Anaerolineales bacterium]
MDILEGNILVVDDHPGNLDLLNRLLEKRGFKVQAVSSGPAALEIVRINPPDLILLDINMPEMIGFNVGQHLLADPKTRDIPIIFIRTLDDMESKLKAFAAGGVDYVTKPFRTNEVLARVNTHLNLRDMQKQLQLGKNILESTADAVSDILILTDLQGIIIRRYKTVASTPINTYRGLISITISLGLATIPDNRELELEEFIDRADKALFKAQNSGRDQIGI